MQSFRTELENPLVEKDIIDLERKIRLFREGKIHEEKFRSLRLARGVYGQRQQGVQMVRIKLPYGKMTLNQWKRIADISDEYATGNLHLTTRQDIQIHFVSLDKTPELWSKLEKDKITLREACGNTVRNITGSPTAGIDPKEPFDITPYTHSAFEYFLRNPVCQEMGRKFKIAFSNTDDDTAITFIHDLGFIPKIQDGKRGFKVMLGGGLGAQPQLAYLAYEFLEEDLIIPFIEAVIRVFDRYGERNSRHKARMKFLIAKIGFEEFMRLVEIEKTALKVKAYKVDTEKPEFQYNFTTPKLQEIQENITEEYKDWYKTNVFAQKQAGYFGVFVRIPLGDISSEVSRSLIEKLRPYIADDIRVTVNQGLLFRFVQVKDLPYLFSVLSEHNLAAPGANSIANITACPGTDTCNLAISDSTKITLEFEKVLREDFPELVEETNMQIKISGCMNACGQHSMAHIGFHGSSLKSAGKVLPALQVLLGGGITGNGEGRIADKVIKVPSKRGPQVLRIVLNDYEKNGLDGEYFNDYYDRQGEKYFYALLKPLADLTTLIDTDFVDWGRDELFQTEIGVGECASVIIDLVATLFYESEEKIAWAKDAFNENRWADAIYYAYQSQVNTAKALLLDRNINSSTQHGVISEFDKNYGEEFGINFKEQVLQINQNEPSQVFAIDYISESENFLKESISWREANKTVTVEA
ncbi:HEPN domain-containing protein [Emticicia sp. BO119]|uniref:HEPN domain-containing protein n=1 Tax=Emticicia sp. BO119 TaxID=2757768 RepID=UPI0015F09652|nr:HEPN domain-containing protein [Emticicia sp. BO119]MBA4850086.1 HEPN domain-containing protein [Emticicia sp. BO119]